MNVFCPTCNKQYEIANPGQYQCIECNTIFTVMENTQYNEVFKISSKHFIPNYILSALLITANLIFIYLIVFNNLESVVVPCFLSGIFGWSIILRAWVAAHFTKLTLDDSGVICLTSGFWVKKTIKIHAKDIRGISLTQNFFQRFFSIGTLEMSTAGRSGAEIKISGVENPERIIQMIESIRSQD